MRRPFIFALALFLMLPLTALAGSWKTYDGHKLGFRVRYPSTWQVASSTQSKAEQVVVSHGGTHVYNVQILVLDVHPGKSLSDTVARFVSYQTGLGDTGFKHVHWKAAKVGGKKGRVGVLSPPSEGGVSVSQAYYIVPWKAHIYQIMLAAYERHALKSARLFPGIYRQILSTWRFV